MQEEQEAIVQKANRYDEIEKLPGWMDLHDLMAERINDEIAAATSPPPEWKLWIDWPEKQRVHVVRWNAMRELLDSALNDMKDTKKFRDEIIQLRREEEAYARSGRTETV